MDHTRLREIEARCTQEAMPKCRARCPLRMDVRAFMEHMAAGKMGEARKVLERHLPLPEIMARICDHPCEERCLRRDLGGSLAIGALEAACVSAVDRQGRSFPRAPKPASIAVIGNGLAGLTVAFELSRKAWPVTVFHEDEAHGALLRRFPQLSEDVVYKELAALEKAGCSFRRQELVAGLLEEAGKEFAAFFVDADAAIDIFSELEAGFDPLTALAGDKICAGGLTEKSPTGHVYASASRQAGEGRRAALTLERLVTGVALMAGREGELSYESPLYTPLDGVHPQEAVAPQGEVYTMEEAAREAARCIRCECLACVKECVYLQKYGSYPRGYARQIFNNASIVMGERQANTLINGCMLCGQCTELCPERFSMAELCLMARRDMVKRGYMPPSDHEFALEDMDSANDDACALFMSDPGGQKNAWAFFPGCQLSASRGGQVRATYEFLRAIMPEGVGLFLCCCGVPAHWAGNENVFAGVIERLRAEWDKMGRPTLIMACASCLKTFREAAPDIACVSLWEILERHYDETQGASPGSSGAAIVNASSRFMTDDATQVMPRQEHILVIHDPCAARNDKNWQRAVRGLAAGFGFALEEPKHTGAETACCGYGGLVWAAQPDLADSAARHRAESLGKKALASCIMCRDRLVNQGAECLYLLDLLPFSANEDINSELAGKTPPPGLSARRANRAELRRKILLKYGYENIAEPVRQVRIGPELLVELERKHILRDDVETAVLAIETRKSRFLERGSGHYAGSWRPRNVTFWVRYTVEADGAYLLHDAWCHRMIVPGAGERL